jgi:hypothetical protein
LAAIAKSAVASYAVVDLPADPIAVRALDLARAHEHVAIVNHSVRTYLHAARIARDRDVDHPADLLFLACVLHDIGTADAYDGTQRFEVDGADAAARFLTEQGFAAPDVDQVWEAIALHTSPHIAERRGPVPMLTRLGVLADFDAANADAFADRYPRLDVERVLTGAVVAQALRNPAKAPASTWPGGLYRAYLASEDNAV